MFGESQFEAYRALGEYIIHTVEGRSQLEYQSIESFLDAVKAHMERGAAADAREAA